MTPQIDVFISYKRQDRSAVDLLLAALRNAGYIAVTDENIRHNDDYSDAITAMIRAAKLTLVLWTTGAATSKWVLQEARLALKLEDADKPNKCLGVLVDDVEVELPADIHGRQMLPLFPEGLTPASVGKVVEEATKILGSANARSPDDARLAAQEKTLEMQHFDIVSEIDTAAAYAQFRERFQDGVLAEEARQKQRAAGNLLRRPWRRGNRARTVAVLALTAGMSGSYGAFEFGRGFYSGEEFVPQPVYAEAVTARDQLEKDLATAQAVQETTQRDLDVALAGALDLQTALDVERREREDEVAEYDARLVDANSRITALHKAQDRLENELALSQLDRDAVTTKNTELENTINDLRAAEAAERRRRLVAEAELAETKTRLQVAEGALEGTNEELQDTRAEAASLIGELTLSKFRCTTGNGQAGTYISDLGWCIALNVPQLNIGPTVVGDLPRNRIDLSPLTALNELRVLETPDGAVHRGRAAVQQAIRDWSP